MFRFVRNPDPRKKPPYGSRIDPTHPLAQGLVGCWLFNEGGGNKVFDLVEAKSLIGNNDFNWSNNVLDSGTNGYLESQSSKYKILNDLTVILSFKAIEATDGGCFCAIEGSPGETEDENSILYLYNNGGNIYYIHEYSSGQNQSIDTQINLSELQTNISTIVCKRNASVKAFKAFFNRELRTNISYTYNPTNTATNLYLSLSSRSNGNNQIRACWEKCYIYNCVLEDSEVLQLHAEPYSFILVPQYWYMVDLGAVGGGEIVVSDSGSGSDSLSQIAVSLALSDSGAGSDSLPSLQASFGLSDQGTGSDFLSQLLAALSIGDSGTGADTLSPMSVSASVSDTGAASDSISSLTVTLSVSDTGTGTDVVSVLKELLKTIYDSGIASDIVSSIAVNVAIPDSASGQDNIHNVSATLILSDTASGLDAITVLKELLKQVADSGLGTDSVSFLNVSFAMFDAGEGNDILSSISARIPISDLGSAIDAVSVLTEIVKSIFESGQGTDTLSSISVDLGVADNAAGADSIGIEVALTISDAATSTEVITIAKTALKVITDSGIGADTLSGIVVNVPVKDYGQGLDFIAQITAILSISDLGVATDVVLKYDTAVKLVSISFRLRKPNIEFGLKTNKIEFKLYT